MAIPWLADVLRQAGVPVVEEGNWQARGVSGSFAPIGVLWHHTASRSSAANPAPALQTVITGRSDLEGPLCHALVDYNGVFHIISANRANHAGDTEASGPIPESTNGNGLLIGWEIDYAGDQPTGADQSMTPAQYASSVAATAAVLKQLGRDASYARGHRETSTTGKIDPSFVNLDTMRADVARAMNRLSNVAVYRRSAGTFYIRPADGGTPIKIPFGAAGDLPAVGRYENTAFDNLAVYRQNEGVFYIRPANGGPALKIPFGAAGDYPAPGHYEDTPYDNLAVYRQSEGAFYIRPANGGAARKILFGQNGDVPAIGRYENSTFDNLAVYRRSDASFYIRPANGGPAIRIPWGSPGDIPAPAYYEGGPYTNIAVFRPGTNTFYIRRANNTTLPVVFGDGSLGDYPAPGKFQ
jgi:hypothetical protein